MTTGGHQALFNGILAVKDDMEITIAYQAQYTKAYCNAEKEFLSRVPNAVLHPLYCQPSFFVRCVLKIRNVLHLLIGKDIFSQGMKIELINGWMNAVAPQKQKWIEHLMRLCTDQQFDIIQVEMPWLLSSVFALPKCAKKVFVHHELGFIRREQEMLQVPSDNHYANSIRRYADHNEISLLNMYDSVITLSTDDTKKLINKGVTKPVYSSFAVIDHVESINPEVGNGKRLTFIGPEGHNSNYTGLLWFLQTCWGNLKQKDPEITLDVIGKWDIHKTEILNKYDGINFLGYVNDLTKAIQGSTMIVPIIVGSGIRMKILEASSIGVPFVSTVVGAEGIPVMDGTDCFITDDPNTFVDDILKLQNKHLRISFIKNSNEMVKKYYSLESLRINRLDIYKEITTAKS